MISTIDLSGKAAIVTGAASGIGEAIAVDLSAHGASVLVVDRNNTAGSAAAARLPRCLYQSADVASPEECAAVVETAVREWGGVDILVNNAGFQYMAPVEEFPLEKWEEMIRVMLTAPFLLTSYSLPHMYAKGWGRIVNIASALGVTGQPYKAAYCSAKHGLLGLTKSVALEAGPRGVTVNAICPAYVKTPLVDKQIDDQARLNDIPQEKVVQELMLERAAIQEFILPEDVAAYVTFLCSEGARCVTGGAVLIDGGYTAK